MQLGLVYGSAALEIFFGPWSEIAGALHLGCTLKFTSVGLLIGERFGFLQLRFLKHCGDRLLCIHFHYA